MFYKEINSRKHEVNEGIPLRHTVQKTIQNKMETSGSAQHKSLFFALY